MDSQKWSLNPRAGEGGKHEPMLVGIWRTFSGVGFFPLIDESLQNFILWATNRLSVLLNQPFCSGPSLDQSSKDWEKTYLNPGPVVLRESRAAQVISSLAHRTLSPFLVSVFPSQWQGWYLS